MNRVSAWNLFLMATTFCILSGSSGCGNSNSVKLLPVEGVVTLDGEPVSSAIVTFYPQGGRPSAAHTNDEGKFTLRYTQEKNGAVVGNHRVQIEYGGPQAPGGPSGPGTTAKPTKQLPYRSFEWPETVVVSTESQTFQFNLTK